MAEEQLIKSALTGGLKLAKMFYNSWSESKKEKAKQKAIDNLKIVICLIPSKMGKTRFSQYISKLNNDFVAFDFDQIVNAEYQKILHPSLTDTQAKETLLNQFYIEYFDNNKDKIKKLAPKVVIITSSNCLVNYAFTHHQILPLVFSPEFDFLKSHLETLEISKEEKLSIEREVNNLNRLNFKKTSFQSFEELREKISFYFPTSN